MVQAYIYLSLLYCQQALEKDDDPMVQTIDLQWTERNSLKTDHSLERDKAIVLPIQLLDTHSLCTSHALRSAFTAQLNTECSVHFYMSMVQIYTSVSCHLDQKCYAHARKWTTLPHYSRNACAQRIEYEVRQKNAVAVSLGGQHFCSWQLAIQEY